ncbi:HAD family hydrolase [Pseudactinotalea suaedae]|uniref:HAD family hydrolase n=1 Tax=Pseudactinotalea suaedae TaxID=1524924 RepID=UPI001F503AC1|nr:HAD family hydrolase [Pseudactinotalea suaedae]
MDPTHHVHRTAPQGLRPPRKGRTIRSIIWDFGGTLVDTYPDVDRALARAAFADDDEQHLAEVAALTRISSGHAIGELADRTGVAEDVLRAAYDGVKELWQHTPAPVMPHAREVMAAVTEVGGLNLVATHRDRGSAEQLLRATGLAVDDMVCAPDGYERKPSPQMVQVLLERHRLAPAEVIAVGDRPGDAEAARAVGVTGLLLVTPGIPLALPANLPQIASLRELLPMLA